MPRALKSKISRNERNKVKTYQWKFGYKITNNSREALLLDNKNGNTLWSDVIVKYMNALERLSVIQLYPPKPSFRIKIFGNMRQCILFFM